MESVSEKANLTVHCWTCFCTVWRHIWGLPGDANSVRLRDSVLIRLSNGRSLRTSQQRDRDSQRCIQTVHDVSTTFWRACWRHWNMAGLLATTHQLIIYELELFFFMSWFPSLLSGVLKAVLKMFSLLWHCWIKTERHPAWQNPILEKLESFIRDGYIATYTVMPSPEELKNTSSSCWIGTSVTCTDWRNPSLSVTLTIVATSFLL